jgi:hypothetical protein
MSTGTAKILSDRLFLSRTAPYTGTLGEVDDAVTVFVDDAVLGRLPQICVTDGVETDDRIVQRIEVGGRGLGVASLLVLAGPIGWLGLALVSLGRRPREVLTVELPMSEPAYLRLRAARRRDSLAGVEAAIAAIGLLLAVVVPWNGAPILRPFVALALAAAVVAAVVDKVRAYRRLRSMSVECDLDASRRWVTIYGAHPAFVAAAQSPDDHFDRV